MSATEAEGSSGSGMDSSEKNSAIKKSEDLIAEGKRHMVCGEVPKAVNVFEEAVKLVVQHCGEMSYDCANAYFNCGSALLELGRMETNVLGVALDGVDVEEEKEEVPSDQFEKPPDEEGEEREKLRDEVYEAMSEGPREEEIEKLKQTEKTGVESIAQEIGGEKKGDSEAVSKESEKSPTKKEEQQKSDSESKEEAGEEEGDEEAAEGEDTAEGEESQDGEESQEGDEKEDDVSHFQLAWEYLDIAKVIYLKSELKEDQLKGADCLMKLGELSMETEQHETAAEDLKTALGIQEKQLDADDRLLAETHYQLGLAYSLAKDFELSIQHYTQAISVIEAKIASLNKLVEENEVDADNKENRETDSMTKYKEEIKELQELIPEMKNKIEDAKVERKDLDKMKEMAKEMLGLSGTTKGFGSPTKKVDASGASGSMDVDENGEKKATDISSLVRRKRKPEEDEGTKQELKKPRQEEGASGDLPAVKEPVVNGTKEEPMANGTSEVSNDGDKAQEVSSSAAEPMAV